MFLDYYPARLVVGVVFLIFKGLQDSWLDILCVHVGNRINKIL
jgi:hypothetical protein